MRIAVKALNLKMRHVFAIARGSVSVTGNAWVRVRYGALEGWGEAAPSRYYGQTQESVLKALASFRPPPDATPFDYEKILALFAQKHPGQSSALAALDCALHDLLGKKLGVPLWKLWGLDRDLVPQTSFTLGLAEPAELERKTLEAARYPILKVKLGRPGDLELLRLVRRLAPKKVLRVDANGGWTVKEAIAKAKELERLEVEFLEQPIKAGDVGRLRRVKERVGLPIFTDESSVTAEDVPALRWCADCINIKLAKCGGLSAARRMIAVGRACELKIMLGCMLESSLGIAAAAQLAPAADYLDLDGHLLLAADPFEGLGLTQDCRLKLSLRPGLGIQRRLRKA
jgi:L-alanine-DL-glutamate epimerase-like enolase superfamily enzyme